MTDDRSLQSLLNSFDWEVVLDLGGFDLTAAPDSTSIAFDQGGTATLTTSASQRVELERRGFERVDVLLHGVDGQQFNPARRSEELRAGWGLGGDDLGAGAG